MRHALASIECGVDRCENTQLERDELYAVVQDIRTVMSVAPEVPDTQLADLIFEVLRTSGGTTHEYDQPTPGSEAFCQQCALWEAEQCRRHA
jgi:hypothetical protein